MGESLWGLLERIVEQRNQIHVDEDGQIERLSELDELVAAKHVKRFITVWSNRQRKEGAVHEPLPGQTTLDEVHGEGEDGHVYAGEIRVPAETYQDSDVPDA